MVEGHPNIKMSNSIVDYVFRALGVEYLQRDELVQVPPNREAELPEPPKGLAVESGIQLDLTDAAAEKDVEAVAQAAEIADAEVAVAAAPVAAAPAPAPSSNGTSPSSNGSTATAVATQEVTRTEVQLVSAADATTAAAQAALGDMMGDAPLCDTCGHITVRNGSCYKCLNCGNSLGCS